MNQGNDPSHTETDGGTRVDLGEDLLEKTTSFVRPTPQPQLEDKLAPGSISGTQADQEDLIQDARILINERMIDDAKKLLRKILIANPHHIEARKLLDDVLASELQHLFTEGEVRKPFRERQELALKGDPEEVMHQLDRDLGLGIFSDTVVKTPVTSDSEMYGFSLRVESALANAQIQDWIDLGIGFLEMELYPVAIRLFAGACRRVQLEGTDDPSALLSSTCLLAFALIEEGRPLEAVSRIQPLLRDVEMRHEDKGELYYLMGRVYEMMKKYDHAGQFYRKTLEIYPHYKDVEKRIRKMGVSLKI